MNPILMFTAEIIMSLCLSTALIFIVTHPLRNAVRDLCPTEKQAAFWVSYTQIMLTLTPLLLVLTVDVMSTTNDALENIQITLISALVGLLIGMIIVGKKIYIPVSQQLNKSEADTL